MTPEMQADPAAQQFIHDVEISLGIIGGGAVLGMVIGGGDGLLLGILGGYVAQRALLSQKAGSDYRALVASANQYNP